MSRHLSQEISEDRRPLPASFYRSEDTVRLARQLIGKVLVSRQEGITTSGIIVETEAYRAPEDKASHAFGNRRTSRTEIMFAEGGHAYVYLIYGMHHLFNVVTGPAEIPHAILIRAVEPLQNIPAMLDRRNMTRPERRLTAGPGVLSQALRITTRHWGIPLRKPSGIWLEEDPDLEISPDELLAGPRVNVDYAGESAAWPWRFRLRDNPWTSIAR